MSRSGAAILASGGALLWGTMGPVADLLASQLSSAEVAMARSVGAVVVLAAMARSALWSRSRLVRHRRALLAGGVGLAGFQYCYFTAVAEAGVAVSTMVAIGAAPVLTGAYSWLRRSAGLSATWFAGTAVAVVGVVLLAADPHPGGDLTGTLWALGAAAFFGMQALAIDAVGADSEWSTTAMLTWMFVVCVVVSAPVGGGVLITGPHLSASASALLVYLGVATAGLAYWLFARGVAALGAPAAVTISLLEPVAAAAIAAIALGERLGAAQWCGMALVSVSVLVAVLERPVVRTDKVRSNPRADSRLTV
ncbi:DMT family transporter [Rhodococcoides kroppenstedtii]|uniref:DMT family transporter n=1 Tax=Rhodococcoides kroppenstedtii TaxID=293050 RepID=UPI0036332C90